MIRELKHFTVQMIAGANVATIVIMFLVGFSDYLLPERYPALSNAGLLFPIFLLVNLGFLFFWLIFKVRYVLIPFAGFLVCYVPVRQYCPFNWGEDAPDDAIKVLSYNVLNYAGEADEADGVNPVVRYLQEQDADIVCLQESAFNQHVKNQIDSLLRPMYTCSDTTIHARGGDCLTLFSKYPILAKERIYYESRGNLSVAYQLKIDEDTVLLVNNHLETTGLTLEERSQFRDMMKGNLKKDPIKRTSRLMVVKLAEATRKRAPEARAVAQYIAGHPARSVILCGDFNDGPISYAHRVISQGLTDCYVASGNGPGISYHKSGFFVRIDNILCSEDWEPYECKVDDKIGVSDHYPIVCKLKKRPKH